MSHFTRQNEVLCCEDLSLDDIAAAFEFIDGVQDIFQGIRGVCIVDNGSDAFALNGLEPALHRGEYAHGGEEVQGILAQF